MDKKKIVVIGVALIAIVIILSGAAFALVAGGESYDSKVAQGYRLIEEGDFNGAVLLFEEAVSLDPAKESAYLGLYNAYVKSGQYDLALSTVRRGISASNGAQLQALLPQIELYVKSVSGGNTEVTTSTDKKTENLTPTLNKEFLAVLGAANYGDYGVKYGAASVTVVGTEYHARPANLPATLIYFDTGNTRVIDQSKGVPYGTYMPNKIKLDNVMILFGGGDTISYTTLRNMPGLSDLTREETTVKFTYGNCSITITCDSNQMITTESDNLIVPIVSNGVTGKQKLQLTVVDATTGKPVSGATVKAYPSYVSGMPEKEAKTESNGTVALELEKTGNYVLRISKDGYIEEDFTEYLVSGENFKTLAIAPAASGDVIRFVVSWGSYPRDLDCYLRGRTAGGTNVDINFTNMSATESGREIASLDVDDMDGHGPETVTLSASGEFDFMVTDYGMTGDISRSQAQVKIYVGSSLYKTITVPAGLENGWHVCRVVNGEIIITNRAQSTSYGRPS